MGRQNPPGSNDSAARAFARVGTPKLLAKLYRFATVTLHLPATDAASGGVDEAMDLVNTLVERALAKELPWDLPDHATEDEIVRHACTMLRAMHWNLRRRAARSAGADALDEIADDAPDAFAGLLRQQGIAEAEDALAHDAEALVLLRMMLDGMRRAEIVAQLGCTIEHANAVRKRIAYGLAARRARLNDDSEDEPPSSGPRGNHHDLQATEERRGAAPEPHRGAVRAGRRR